MMREKTVLVAMSGGVDSAVTAALLLERGFRVMGVTMLLAPEGSPGSEDALPLSRNVQDAAQVCRKLGIGHETMDLAGEFRSKVVAPFIRTYLSGRTPNPCILCNEHVKFRFLFERARVLGADMVATGHFAQVLECGTMGLARGVDREKDQSYFLFFLGQEELGHLVLPLGRMLKKEVREKARVLGLPVHEKGESQDACFLQAGGIRNFLKKNAALLPGQGRFVDRVGNRLGIHEGACFFTVGQRKGLGIAAPHPLFVMKIDAVRNEVVLGSREEASSRGLVLSGTRWIKGIPPESPFRSHVQVRYRQVPVPCQARFLPDGSLEVVFDEAQHGVAPGQAAVFYDGENLLGGGWISANVSMRQRQED